MFVFAGLQIDSKELPSRDSSPDVRWPAAPRGGTRKKIYVPSAKSVAPPHNSPRRMPFSFRVMEHDRTLHQPYGGNQRPSIWGHRDAFLLRRPRGSPLWHAAGKPLSPDVKVAVCIGAEVHPGPIRRPPHVRTPPPRRTDNAAPRAPVEGNQPTGKPSAVVHLRYQHPLMVGGDRRAVCHASLPWRHIDVTAILAVLPAVLAPCAALLDFGEKDGFSSIQVRPSALASISRDSPPSTGTAQVSQAKPATTV